MVKGDVTEGDAEDSFQTTVLRGSYGNMKCPAVLGTRSTALRADPLLTALLKPCCPEHGQQKCCNLQVEIQIKGYKYLTLKDMNHEYGKLLLWVICLVVTGEQGQKKNKEAYKDVPRRAGAKGLIEPSQPRALNL